MKNLKLFLLPVFVLAAVAIFSVTAFSTAFAGTIQPISTRFGGSDRYGVAANVSRAAYPDGTSTVILVNGSNDKLADALAATPLAKAWKAPILLVDQNTIPQETLNELTRLKPANVYIIGGPGSVSEGLEDNLKTQYEVERIGGADRYVLAQNIADKLKEVLNVTSFDKVFVCNGIKYSDALAAAPVAARAGDPILFVSASMDGTTNNTLTYIKSLGASAADVIGGPASVNDGVVSKLGAKRIGGANREALSVSVASNYCQNPGGIFVVNGYCPADALSVGPYAANYDNYPVLYVDSDGKTVDNAVTSYITANKANIKWMIVSGGTASVTNTALNSIANGYTGLNFVDTNMPLDADTCSAIKAQGFTGVIRYVGLDQMGSYDLTSAEVHDILNSGLGLMIVQHPRDFDDSVSIDQITKQGTTDGQNAVKYAKALGIPTNGLALWLDLEGVQHKAGDPTDNISAYCQAWYHAVDGNYIPGIYVGYDSYLSSTSLYYLPFQHYWRSLSTVPDVDIRGYEMIQLGYPDINGINMDIDSVYKDSKGDGITYYTQNGVVKP